MATFTINEYGGVGQSMGGVIPVFSNHITDQAAITTSASSQQSSAFNANTKIVHVTTTAAVRVKFGSNPTATSASHYLGAGEGMDYYTEGGTEKVAVIDA